MESYINLIFARSAKVICLLIGLLLIIACEPSEDEPPIPKPQPPDNTTTSNLWFGYYQEDRLNNPEDPESDLVYLHIPGNGSFEGELFFEYNGCDGGFDVGFAQGSVDGEIITGSWEGRVDGAAVGGPYNGRLANSTNPRYEGVYDNNDGKIEIECSEDFRYFVAAKGTWFISKSNNDEAMEIRAEVSQDNVVFKLEQISDVALYQFVVVEQKCLEDQRNLENCLAWGGISFQSDISYGDGGNLTATSLVKDINYVIAALAIGNAGEVLAASSKEFTF